jgi:hypothetical protein
LERASPAPTYRNRYAQYRLDPDLQRLHAGAPALVTWDDHEVQNDYADRYSQNFDDPALFLQRPSQASWAKPIMVRPSSRRSGQVASVSRWPPPLLGGP